MVAEIDAGQILAQRNLVAKRRCQKVGVGVASDVTQQRLMIDIAALALIEIGGFVPAASPARRTEAQNPSTGRWPDQWA